MKQSRHEMFVELASDDVTNVSTTYDYTQLHAWLQPIFIKLLQDQFKDEDDQAVADHFANMLGTPATGWETDQ